MAFGPNSSKDRRPTLVSRIASTAVAILIGVSIFGAGYRAGSGASGTSNAGGVDISRFEEVLNLINNEHVGPETEKQLVDGAIKGLVEALNDPYSQYLTGEEQQSMIDSLSGSFEGIGAVIEGRAADGAPCSTLGPDCALTVVSPIDGSPALRAGISSGDQIKAIDSVPVDGKTVDEAVVNIRGAKGSTVVITIVRGSAAPTPISIVRDVITIPAVEPKVLRTPNGATVGYLRLAEFSEIAGDQFHAALQNVIDAKTTRIVLDLRDNPGGYLSTALRIASEFIGDGVVYIEEDKAGVRTETRAQGGGLATSTTVRLIVLVNKGSASASEILAGALQDRGRAVLVGETTFGKGVVQTFMDLSDGSGLKLTIAKWLTPNGRWIQGTGLTPDRIVPTVAPGSADDPVLAAALSLLD